VRRAFTILAITAVAFLGSGVVAEAAPATYKVSKSWSLAYVDGTPTIKPHIDDDVVEVTCRNDDQMKRWTVNRRKLVAGSWRRIDGTGIQVQPEFAPKTATIRITVFCQRS
jgi:hypothetical protein